MKQRSAMRIGLLCLALLAAPAAYAWGKSPEAQSAPSSAVITATDVSSGAAAMAANVPSGQAAEAASAAAEAAKVPSGAAARKPAPSFTGFLEMGSDGAFVKGDKARFREDNWMPNGAFGGLSNFLIRSTGPDENGLEYQVDGRLMYPYDYRLNFLLKKKNAFYVTFNASETTKWFDPSAEAWKPQSYRLSGLFASQPGDLSLENRNMNLEVGLTPRDGPEIIFGWHRFQQVGADSMLRGGQASLTGVAGALINAIPVVDYCNRLSDLYYFEISKTFDGKYNFRLRQEFENCRDSESTQEYDYAAAAGHPGVLSASSPQFQENDRYQIYTSIISFDSFLNDNTYFGSGYMFQHSGNHPDNNYYQPYNAVPSSRVQFYTLSSSVEENTNVWSNGIHEFNIFGVKDLDATAAVRAATEPISGDTFALSGATHAPVYYATSVNEREASETAQLAYRGWQRTNLIFDAKLDQRQYPIFEQTAPTTFSDAEDGWQNQSYKMTAVERFNNAVKTTASWRFFNERSTCDRGVAEGNALGYPNFLGPMLDQGNEVRVSTDLTLNATTAFNFLYQYTGEHIQTEAGDITVIHGIPIYMPRNVEHLNENQIGGSIITSPVQNLSVVGTLMSDNYVLKTPGGETYSAAIAHARGNSYYNFIANAVTLSLDLNYAFNTKTSAYCRFERTGTTDYSSNDYNTVGVGLSRKITKNQTVTLGYQYIDYCNAGEFENYSANMILATYRINF